MVPRTVAPNELLVRGIVTPFHLSKESLKREAFLPPPNSKEVSLLRHQYTDDDKCKSHCRTLRVGESTYCGLAVFLHQHVMDTNLANPTTEVIVVATPLDENNNIVEREHIYSDDIGLPMHADLLYDKPAEKGKGIVRTNQRIFAEALLERVIFYKDGDISKGSWTGPPLSSTFRQIKNTPQ